MRMLLRIERTIARPFPLLESALLSGPSSWLPGPRAGDPVTTELDVRIAGCRIAHRVTLSTGQASCWPARAHCAIPLRWHAARHRERYPTLAGALELDQVGPRHTRLVLRASYVPPAGLAGRVVDRVVMHAIAEASVEAFVERVSGILERSALSRAVIASSPFPQGSRRGRVRDVTLAVVDGA